LEVYTIVPSSLAEARDFLVRELERRSWIVFFALCRALYEGRGASESTVGDRVVIIKPDGSLIIHSPKGFKPLNWQPETSSIAVSLEGGLLVLRALRRSPREILVLECSSVYSISCGVSPEEGQFWMYMSEHEIRDAIVSNPSMIEDGLTIIEVERPVEPGFIDLYGRDSKGNIVVMEIKRVKAGEEAVRQLLTYVNAFKVRGVVVRGILVAPALTESALKLLMVSGLEYKIIDLKKLYQQLQAKRVKRTTLKDYIL